MRNFPILLLEQRFRFYKPQFIFCRKSHNCQYNSFGTCFHCMFWQFPIHVTSRFIAYLIIINTLDLKFRLRFVSVISSASSLIFVTFDNLPISRPIRVDRLLHLPLGTASIALSEPSLFCLLTKIALCASRTRRSSQMRRS